MSDIDAQKLLLFNQNIPRYTSYPTAPFFEPLNACFYEKKLKNFSKSFKPLSIYIHVPFCKTMCLFCGCSVVLNRKPEVQKNYVDYLLKEIKLVSSNFSKKPKVTQLHFGGGTPTNLNEEEFEKVFEQLNAFFELDQQGEISIEVDPRTVFQDDGKKLTFLRKFFNRISFGVQDLDPKVQEATRRRQTDEMTYQTFIKAKNLGFEGINIDLIYGLPLQTVDSFDKTAQRIASLGPDRIAMYSYAKIPWLKPHQKAIKEKDLPSTLEKFQIYVSARKSFLSKGYIGLGMDHFAKKDDSLAKGYKEKKLYRNFQGYSLKLAEDMLSFGVTSIGFIDHCYVQNKKELKDYYESIDRNEIPVFRGKDQNFDDQLRYWVIQRIMCDFSLKKKQFYQKFKKDFDVYFSKELLALQNIQKDGLIDLNDEQIIATPMGKLLIRNVAASFDNYLKSHPSFNKYSKSI